MAVETMARIDTVQVKEGESFALNFQDEVLEVKWVAVKAGSTEKALHVTVLRRGV